MEGFGSFQDLVSFFFHLYGSRNRVRLHSLRLRLDLLQMGMNDLKRALRKGDGDEVIRLHLARVLSRIMCVTEQFVDPPIVEAMCEKFPLKGCAYCNELPCSCLVLRPEPLLQTAQAEQMQWSLWQFQQHLNALYGEANRKRGIDDAYGRLGEEFMEIAEHEIRMRELEGTPDELVRNICLELADAVAWTCAIASLKGINLETATFARYGKGCPTCSCNPCECGAHSFLPMHKKA